MIHLLFKKKSLFNRLVNTQRSSGTISDSSSPQWIFVVREWPSILLYCQHSHHWLLYPLEFALHRKLGGLLIQLCSISFNNLHNNKHFQAGGGGTLGLSYFVTTETKKSLVNSYQANVMQANHLTALIFSLLMNVLVYILKFKNDQRFVDRQRILIR